MERPTVPPLKRRGDDPELDALIKSMPAPLFERVEDRLSFIPGPTRVHAESAWVKRYARTLTLLAFLILAPGLVNLSLTWVSRWTEPSAVTANAAEETPVAATPSVLPSALPVASVDAPTVAGGAGSAVLPSVAGSAPVATPVRTASSPALKPRPSGAQVGTTTPKPLPSPSTAAPAQTGRLFPKDPEE